MKNIDLVSTTEKVFYKLRQEKNDIEKCFAEIRFLVWRMDNEVIISNTQNRIFFENVKYFDLYNKFYVRIKKIVKDFNTYKNGFEKHLAEYRETKNKTNLISFYSSTKSVERMIAKVKTLFSFQYKQEALLMCSYGKKQRAEVRDLFTALEGALSEIKGYLQIIENISNKDNEKENI